MDSPPVNPTSEALLARIGELEAEIGRLRAENERLTLELAAARKDSSNSSKPPSSDIVKPPSAGGQGKRRIGGQPGHTPHFRQPFTPDQIDESYVFDPPSMTCTCGGELTPYPSEDHVQQQIDLPEQPLVHREYRARSYRCSSCGTRRRGKLPVSVRREGYIGNRLAAGLSFLNVKAHASYSALADLVKNVFGEPVSRGQIAKTFRRMSAALETPYQEALERLRSEPVLHIDETGHREGGKRHWTWVFRGNDFTVFHIDKTRSTEVLKSILGPDFDGTINCDYLSSYRKYLKGTGGSAQFCLAHFIRDIRFLKEHPKAETKRYAERSLKAVRQMFEIYHRLRANPGHDRLELVEAGEKLRQTMLDAPPERKAQNLAQRFRDNGDSYLRFIHHPEIEPTNNRAEQAIRPVVINRTVSQGTRSPVGRNYKARMWTAIATCAQRGVSAFNYLLDALKVHANPDTAPP